jgi:hypothetical protein
MKIIRLRDIDLDKIVISERQSKTKNNCLHKFIHYRDEEIQRPQDLYVQLPYLVAPFGSRKWATGDKDKFSYNLAVSLDLQDNLPIVRKDSERAFILGTLQGCKKFDKDLLDYVTTNSEKIFGKVKDPNWVASTYNSLVKSNENPYGGNVSEIFKAKIPCNSETGEIDLQLYDNDGNSYKSSEIFDYVTPGSRVKLVAKITSLYVVSNAYWGISLKLVSVIFDKDMSGVNSYRLRPGGQNFSGGNALANVNIFNNLVEEDQDMEDS